MSRPSQATWQAHLALNLRKMSVISGHLPKLKFVRTILVALSAQGNLKLNNSIVARLSPGRAHPDSSRAAFCLKSYLIISQAIL